MGVEKAGRGLNDRLVQGTVKFGGGSLMIWECMFWEGPGYATKIDGRNQVLQEKANRHPFSAGQ